MLLIGGEGGRGAGRRGGQKVGNDQASPLGRMIGRLCSQGRAPGWRWCDFLWMPRPHWA